MTQPATPTPLDRIMRAFRALVRAEDPNRIAFGVWEYQVENATSSTFDGSPTEQNFPLPPLVGVPYRPSLAGSSCVPEPGTLAYVAFANADPSKPILVAFGQTLPRSSRLDVAGAGKVTVGDPDGSPLAVARVSDQVDGGVVTAMAGATPVTFTYTPPDEFPLPPSPTLTLVGVIRTGSSKLESE